MPKKKPMKGKPTVHPDLKGLEIKINEFGEFTGTFNVDKVNDFLDDKVSDKKLLERDKVLEEREKNANREINILIANFDLEPEEALQNMISAFNKAQMNVIQSDFSSSLPKLVRRIRKDNIGVVVINCPSDKKSKIYPQIMHQIEKNDLNDVLIVGFEDVNLEENSLIYEIDHENFYLTSLDDDQIVEYIRDWVVNNMPF